jgi:hypothetical protein
MIGKAGLALMMMTGMAYADWVQLDDAGITAALTDRDFAYDDTATQHFHGSGRTRYTSAEPSWGYWRVESGQYCSQWPPGLEWDCYDVFGNDTGAVRWDDAYGNSTIGRPLR